MQLSQHSKSMIIQLLNEQQLRTAHHQLGVPWGAGMRMLIETAALQMPRPKEILFRISVLFVCMSYARNPKILAGRLSTNYPAWQAWPTDHGYICIHLGQTRKPLTFMAKTIASIEKRGFMHALKGKIPAGYLKRPHCLKNRLEKRFPSDSFAIVAKKNSITWKRIA